MSEGTGLNSWKILDGWLGYNGSGCTIIEDLKLSIFKDSTHWKTLSHFRNLPRKALLRDIANQGSETFVSFVTVFKKSCLCGLKQNKKQKSMYTANLPMTLYVHKSNFLLIYKRKHFKTNFSYNLYWNYNKTKISIPLQRCG